MRAFFAAIVLVFAFAFPNTGLAQQESQNNNQIIGLVKMNSSVMRPIEFGDLVVCKVRMGTKVEVLKTEKKFHHVLVLDGPEKNCRGILDHKFIETEQK